ncbi:MAG: CcmD family protein [Candidatus Nephrothrix sp. EaCA]|nr:MAG: CcmD family protein [Candidatus Nephrothrix sp. EaCA]
MKKWMFFLIMLSAQKTMAQDMADRMRADGKIYAVVAVIIVIFIGLLVYLLLLDRKISKLEKKNKK